MSLNQYRELLQYLRKLENEPWTRLSITDQCITLNEKTLNFNDGYTWDFEYAKKSEQDKWNVMSCLNIENTHRQLIIASKRMENRKENIFLAKLNPSSRKFTLFGDVSLDAVELIDFITTT